MPTINNNRKIVDLKRWEYCSPAPTATVAGAFIASSRHVKQQSMYVASSTVQYLYNVAEDGYIQLPSAALAGTFGAGATGCSVPWSTGTTAGVASLTATAGTTNTITTNQTLARDLRGFSIHILAGPNSGSMLPIVSNTIGANSVITVATQGTAFSASTVYRLMTPRWFVVGAGTLAAGSFKFYDYATNTWQTLSNTGLPATLGTDGKLVSTPSWIDTGSVSFATGTATAGASTTLTNSAKTWTANQWTNYQIRITSGTGAGQIRTISGNTSTLVTASAAWTTTPDATSVYSIEGNDDNLYYIGNAAVTMYKYSISANTWSTVAPVSARGAAPGAGASANWVYAVSDSDWTSESVIQNGKYIFSFRGGGSTIVDRYDIAANTWAGLTPAPGTETFTTGTKYAYYNNFIYLQKDATGRWFRYNIATGDMDGWTTMLFPQGVALAGDTGFEGIYVDGTTVIPYIYHLVNTSTALFRQMII